MLAVVSRRGKQLDVIASLPFPHIAEEENCPLDSAATLRVLDELFQVASPNIQRTLSLSSSSPRLSSGPHEANVQQSKAKHLSGNPVPASPCATVEDKVLRCEGDYWTIIYAGTVLHLRDTQGLRYLALLLRTPHRRIPAYQLVTLARGIDETALGRWEQSALEASSISITSPGDGGEILDKQAILAYKHRLEELTEELAEAQSCQNLGCIERLKYEREYLLQELRRAIGKHGRIRRASSDAERARVNVSRALKGTIEKLSRLDPTLGHHLRSTINTGRCCSYTPELDIVSPWAV
jgi:non-specific serine/threonine protein kinase